MYIVDNQHSRRVVHLNDNDGFTLDFNFLEQTFGVRCTAGNNLKYVLEYIVKDTLQQYREKYKLIKGEKY